MNQEILEQNGLTKNEATIYLELLKTGTSSTGPLIKKTSIANSRVYASLETLIEKGLVTFITKNNIKYFRAEKPENLLSSLEEKRKKLEKYLPELKALMTNSESETYNTIFEGFNGFKTAFEQQIELCTKEDEILVVGFSPQAYAFKSLRRFLKNIDEKRIQKEIPMRIILDTASKNSIGKDREKEPYTHVKYMPKGYFSPAAMNIYKDYVLILIWEKNPNVFLIKNEQVANSFKQYYEVLWKTATE